MFLVTKYYYKYCNNVRVAFSLYYPFVGIKKKKLISEAVPRHLRHWSAS